MTNKNKKRDCFHTVLNLGRLGTRSPSNQRLMRLLWYGVPRFQMLLRSSHNKSRSDRLDTPLGAAGCTQWNYGVCVLLSAGGSISYLERWAPLLVRFENRRFGSTLRVETENNAVPGQCPRAISPLFCKVCTPAPQASKSHRVCASVYPTFRRTSILCRRTSIPTKPDPPSYNPTYILCFTCI